MPLTSSCWRRLERERNAKMILQWDHLGVEIALLCPPAALAKLWLATSIFLDFCPRLPLLFQGRDDFFAISLERRGENAMPKSEQCLKKAKKAYDDNRLLGSDDKDICNAREAKVIGGYVNCGGSLLVKKELRLWQPLFRRGLACQLAPLKLSSWPSPLTSSTCLSLEDGLRYCCFGAPSWASCQAFNFVDLSAYSPHAWRVVALPRRVATELCLLAVMAPIISMDLSADYFAEVLATDASIESKGAIVSAPLSRSAYHNLWRCTKRKGLHTRPDENAARRLDIAVSPPAGSDPGQRTLGL